MAGELRLDQGHVGEVAGVAHLDAFAALGAAGHRQDLGDVARRLVLEEAVAGLAHEEGQDCETGHGNLLGERSDQNAP